VRIEEDVGKKSPVVAVDTLDLPSFVEVNGTGWFVDETVVPTAVAVVPGAGAAPELPFTSPPMASIDCQVPDSSVYSYLVPVE